MAMSSIAGSVQMGVLRTLGHDDDEGPAFGVIAHRFREADLGLPHAFRAALAAAVQEENDGPLPAVVAAPILGQIDLKAVGDVVEFDAAVEESRLLRRLGFGAMGFGPGGEGMAGPQREGEGQAGRQE